MKPASSPRWKFPAPICLFLCAAIGLPAGETDAREWPWGKYGIERNDNPCATPTAWPEKDWKWQWFADFKKSDFSKWNTNVILLGDSITYGWNFQRDYANGAKVFKEYATTYPGIRPYSLGVSGDKPQNTLWLVTEGEVLKPFQPRVITLMVGINALNAKHTAEQVAGGVRCIVGVLRRTKPDAKILVFGILPCWGANAPVRDEIAKANELIAKLADNQDVFFLDFGGKLLDAAGNLSPEISYDSIHLTEKGYGIWAQVMFPKLDELLKANGGRAASPGN